MTGTSLPSFDELPELESLGLRHAWGVYGPDDVLGSINLVTPERVARAAALVQTGELISLDLPMNEPNPPLFGRAPYRHEVFALNRNDMDDYLDGFYLQASTQWDSLSHVRCREFGFWGGRTENPTTETNPMGIEHWAEHGVAGRGVLIDVTDGFDPFGERSITADDLAAAVERQGVTLETGDILCIRTGWLERYLALDLAARTAIVEKPDYAGLYADEAMARYLWNAHPAAICLDNPAVESVPIVPAVGSLHRRLLPLLGLALGELFDFEKLATRCKDAGRSTFLFVAAPLKVPGGLGSPGNAVAIL